MSNDVTIPRETARAIAAWLRNLATDTDEPARWADLLDPRPTLRDAVAMAICDSDGGVWINADTDAYRRNADAALAVVRDHIAAMPNPYAWPVGSISHTAYEAALRDVRHALGAES